MTLPDRNEDPTGWAYALLATDFVPNPAKHGAVPRWALPSIVGIHNTWAYATSVLWLARRHSDDTLVVPMVDAAVTTGRHATGSTDDRTAAYCGLTLMAGPVVGWAQYLLADSDPLLGPAVKDVFRKMWPAPNYPDGPRPKAIQPAMALHRLLTTYGDRDVPFLEDLVRLGLANTSTYAPCLRELLRHVIHAERYVREDVLGEPLREALAWYLGEHAEMQAID
jgi:hypothetical protein